jgi:hypothetical protein
LLFLPYWTSERTCIEHELAVANSEIGSALPVSVVLTGR